MRCPNLLGDRRTGFSTVGGQRHGTNPQHETRPSPQVTSHRRLTETKVKVTRWQLESTETLSLPVVWKPNKPCLYNYT